MGEIINAPGGLISADGCFELSMQKDANLVLYGCRGKIGPHGRSVIWASNTDLPHDGGDLQVMCWLLLQTNCNLALYIQGWKPNPHWETNTRGGNCSLRLRDDGNVVLQSNNDLNILWQTHTVGGVTTKRPWWDLG